MRCIDCGKFPFCEDIKNPQDIECEKSVKRPLGIEIEKLKKGEE